MFGQVVDHGACQREETLSFTDKTPRRLSLSSLNVPLVGSTAGCWGRDEKARIIRRSGGGERHRFWGKEEPRSERSPELRKRHNGILNVW